MRPGFPARATVRILLTALAASAGTGAQAEGFALRDLSGIAADVNAALGGGFEHRARPDRVTLTCPKCKGEPMIDLAVGRQTDGTEQRVRSGKTTISRLEGVCRQKSSSCRLSALNVAPAVGWISAYPMGPVAGSTAVIMRDGDLLTIRSIASDARTARSNADKIVRSVAPRIIGR